MKTRMIPAASFFVALASGIFANAQSAVRCSLTRADRDHIVLSWPALPGRNYTLESTSSLSEPWQLVGDFVATTDGLASSIPIGARTRFFRITEVASDPNWQPQKIARTGYAYNPRFANYFQNYSEVPQRVLSIHQQLRDQKLLDELVPIEPVDDAGLSIAKMHTPEHIRGIQAIPIDVANGATEKIGAIADLAVSYILGAVRDVCEKKIRNAFCNIRPPGHHQINSGVSYGYCVYANVVIAARYALERYPNLIHRVLIVDWDLHHGNGTEYFIRNDPAFLFYDTCAGGFYPGGDETRHGLLNATSGNDGLLFQWENELLPLARQFKPDLIVVSCGFDGKRNDALGGESLTAAGYSIFTRKLMDIAEEFSKGRIISILEGGYADSNSGNPVTFNGLKQSAENHVRTLMTGELQPETPFFGLR